MLRLYATVQEFLNHPTGLEVDDLVPDGTDEQQTAELQLVLQAASSAIDQWVYYPLYAHQHTETRQARPKQSGGLEVRLNHFPIQQIVSAQWRQTARDAWHPIDTTCIDLFGEFEDGHKYIAYDAAYSATYGWGQPALTVQTTYVAGYANTLLTADVQAGTNVLTVDNTMGINQGDIIKIYDGANYEEETVDSFTDKTITLSDSLLFDHSAGVRVSQLPDVVPLCCILIAAYLVKERRAGGSVMMGGTVESMNVIDAEDMQLVRQFLQPLRRVI
ncbi:hypothetical protein [Alicyclobacillus fastidiosus]|uniref:Phage gp6-like head-tail connector protein n=1 Tax=Alicyclobacillus fastidiosus TaxID=392011 RepID=A0ABV5ALC4_9BACL|nr:hypothetical protein [Alicyclobacillus fastidiosus]WEH08481.1 hypothetical protein PYS47_17565 [Alicyclobacillus fastidiosus]